MIDFRISVSSAVAAAKFMNAQGHRSSQPAHAMPHSHGLAHLFLLLQLQLHK